MANPYDNDKRLLELLERWQSGNFTRADEQELQSLTDSDEFRREAAEGYMSMPQADHDKHLASLQQKLQARAGTARKFFLPQMLAAAAAVGFILLGVIWLMPSEQKEALSDQVVQSPTSSPMPEDMPEAGSRMQMDTIQDIAASPDLAVAPSRSRAMEPGEGNAVFELSQTAPPGSSFPTMDRGGSNNGPASYGASTPAPPASTNDVAVAPQPDPIIADDEAKAEEVLDEVDMKYGNMAPKQKPAASKAKEQPQTKEAAKKKSSLKQQAQPAGGWDAFNTYLRQSARLPEQARQNNVSGTVRLKFTLDKNDKPGSFVVLKSLGFGCDEFAQQLIEAYPWEPGLNNEITVDVPFVR